MRRAFDVREQLAELMERVEVEASLPCTESDPILKVRFVDSCRCFFCIFLSRSFTCYQAIASGGFFHTAKLDRNGYYHTVKHHLPVAIHPSSCLSRSLPRWVVFNEIVLTTKEFMRVVSEVWSEFPPFDSHLPVLSVARLDSARMVNRDCSSLLYVFFLACSLSWVFFFLSVVVLQTNKLTLEMAAKNFPRRRERLWGRRTILDSCCCSLPTFLVSPCPSASRRWFIYSMLFFILLSFLFILLYLLLQWFLCLLLHDPLLYPECLLPQFS